MEKKIVDVATKDPRKDYGLPFSTWSLRVLAGFLIKIGIQICLEISNGIEVE